MTLLSINWYGLFYWMTRADEIKGATQVIAIITAITLGLSIVGVFVCSNYMSEKAVKGGPEAQGSYYNEWRIWQKAYRTTFIWSVIIFLLSGVATLFVPSKTDCLLIAAGGGAMTFISGDSSIQKLPADVTQYLHLSMKEQIKDLSVNAKEQLGIASPKETFLEKAKDLTKDELIERIKNDSTFTKNSK